MNTHSCSTSGRRLFACQDGRRLCAPGAAARPRDRHTRASLGVVDLEARPCPPDPPAPSTPSVLVSLRLDRPGPAAAHGHRSLALMFRCITKFSDTVVMCTRASYPWLVLLFRMWASYLDSGASLPHVNPLIRALARMPTCGTAG